MNTSMRRMRKRSRERTMFHVMSPTIISSVSRRDGWCDTAEKEDRFETKVLEET